MKRRAILLVCLLASPLIGASTGARAERIIASASNHRVTITPNYAGEQLVLFGSIEQEGRAQQSRTAYDVVVTIAGPRSTLITRRKARKLGIWVNADSRQFEKVPTYLAIFSNRPIGNIANAETMRRLQLGITNTILTQRVGPDFADVVPSDPFRTAFVRLRSEEGLYRENDKAVTFLTPTLFRVSIPLPAAVPIGAYNVDIKAFADGTMVARSETAFEIVKIGFEQYVADAARHHGLVYGLITVLMALSTGWLASIIFRRD